MGATTNTAAPYDARAVANFFLDMADDQQLPLTQMSVLKLIYFAHGWYLAAQDRPLIEQDFEAWQHGPVVKVVRDEFKTFEDRPITARAYKRDVVSGRRLEVSARLAEADAVFVKGVFDAYHVFDAWQLSALTHEKGSPWDRVWNASEPFGRLALRLRNADIRDHFAALTRRLPNV